MIKGDNSLFSDFYKETRKLFDYPLHVMIKGDNSIFFLFLQESRKLFDYPLTVTCHGYDHMNLQLPIQSVPITTLKL